MNLTPAQVEFLSKPNICIMATADARGRPHAVPVWYRYDGSAISIMTGKGSRKYRNLLENPWVALSFDDREPPYYACMIVGTVEFDDEPSYEERLAISMRYYSEEDSRALLGSMTSSGSAIIRLTSGRVVEYNPA